MSLSSLHAIATVLAVLGFFAVCWWAFTPANRKRFEQDGLLVLKDDPIWDKNHTKQAASIDSVSRENP